MESNYWARLNRRRLSRRSLLTAGGTAALGVGAAAMVGCGGGGSGFPKTSATPYGGVEDGPIPGGIVTIGRPLPVLGIDPHIDLTGLDIDSLLYSYLYSWNPSTDEATFNNFAESVEMPADDQTEFIFKLRQGVIIQELWDNPAGGGDLRSKDCLESFVRRGTMITAFDKRFPLRISGESSNDSSHALALRAALRTPDPYTFAVQLSEPFVPALREMSNPTWAIMPSEVIERSYGWFGPGGPGSMSWGSGPFMLTKFEMGERVILKRHPKYFLAPRPWPNEIHYEIITDPPALIQAFDSRQIDVIPILSRAEAEERRKSDDLTVEKAPARFYPVVHLNIRGKWEDRRVREAFDLALDREEMISRIWDGDAKYNGPVPWHLARFSLPQEELRAAMPHDPDRAKRLLAEAGYENGFEVRMQLPKMHGVPFVGQLAVLIKEQVARIGITLIPEEEELGTFIGHTLLSGMFDLALFPQLPYDEPDRPLSFYHPRGLSGGLSWNYSGRPDYKDLVNPEIVKLIDAQSVDSNAESRTKTILKVQRLILKEHGPQLTLPSGYLYSAHWNYVHNPFGSLFDAGGHDGRLPGIDTWTERAQPTPTEKVSP